MKDSISEATGRKDRPARALSRRNTPRVKTALIAGFVVCFFIGSPGWAQFERPGENMALGKPYTMSPAPNYPYTRDENDTVHLTDGEYSEGRFHVQPSTVGWRNVLPEITVDLGRVEPIIGVSVNMGGDHPDIHWPDAVGILVSEDGGTWWNAGELVGLSARKHRPPPVVNTTHRFWTDELMTRGRYVRFIIQNFSRYRFIFIDEIEIYRAPDPGAVSRPVRPAISGRVDEDAAGARMRAGVDLFVSAEAARIGREIKDAALGGPCTLELTRKLESAKKHPAALELHPGFKTVFPIGEKHRELMAVRAALWRAVGLEEVIVWNNNRWDPVSPSCLPGKESAEPVIGISMLGNEVRSESFNVSFSGDNPAVFDFELEGFGEGPVPEGVSLRTAAWTLKRGGESSERLFNDAQKWLTDYYDSEFLTEPTASALPEAAKSASGWRATVLPGCTQQFWLMADSRIIPPGIHRGELVLSRDGKEAGRVPLEIRVSSISLPEEPTMTLGGWDYTDGYGYSVTPRNLKPLVEFLREYHVTAPWATFHVMPFGKHDETGAMVSTPSTARMERWLALWPEARYWGVYFNNFIRHGDISDDPALRRKIGEWARFWESFFEERGIAFSRVYLHVFDENHSASHDANLISHAEAIKKAVPEATIWTDPTWKDLRDMDPRVLELADVICPLRVYMADNREAYERVLLSQREKGKRLALYSCQGPVRALDPYSYHRLQAWEAFKYGMDEQHFWAFGSAGHRWRYGGSGRTDCASSWNELAVPGTPYAPQMLGPDGCVTAKHMEAVREGLYDYEYLLMLERAGEDPARFYSRVLDAENIGESADIFWMDERDRGRADYVRERIIDVLEDLSVP